MTNTEIAKLLRNVVAALVIRGENRFRIAAYEKAADSIEHLTSEVKDIWDEGNLESIPGVGKAIAKHLDELIRTGKVKYFATLIKGLSLALFIFLEIPGLGPKRAHQLTVELKINHPDTAIKELFKAAKEDKIAKIEGWGNRSQAELISAIELFLRNQIKKRRMPLPYADNQAQEIIKYLKGKVKIQRIDVLGSLRRQVATIGDIDLAVATDNPREVVKAFVGYPKARKILDQGEKGATILLNSGIQADLRVQYPVKYGAMLQYFTGSKNHNIHLREIALKKNLSLSEHGIKKLRNNQKSKIKNQNYISKLKIYEYPTEEEFYGALGMDWIPPELREDSGEIEASVSHKLPKLVEERELMGDLHIHSNYDLKPSHDIGLSSLDELLDEAKNLNYNYIGISDHNPKVSNQSEREIVEIVKKRREKFEQIYSSWSMNVKNRVHLFIMLEVNINPMGKIALPNEAFNFLDAVIVSVHSSFKLPKKVMTDRIIKGLSHPKARILGHPTGRLLESRESYEADWEKIFNFCVENNKALEINACADRLDLPDFLVREAVRKQVKFVISTDSHDKEQMKNLRFGVSVARRGWAEKKDILNTMGYNDFNNWLKS